MGITANAGKAHSIPRLCELDELDGFVVIQENTAQQRQDTSSSNMILVLQSSKSPGTSVLFIYP